MHYNYLTARSFILIGVVTILYGLGYFLFSEQALMRFAQLDGEIAERHWISRGFGAGVSAIGLSIVLEVRPKSPVVAFLILGLLAILGYLAFIQQLSNWWIDDSGVTFAYSRSLAEGFGVTFQPGQMPTEGYSSTLWMLILALIGWVGIDIPLAAKYVGISFGVMTLIAAMRLVWIETRSPTALALTAAGVGTTPFLVWSASGQEHALQAFLLVLIPLSIATSLNWRPWVTLLLTLFVLVRPEAPIIVIAVFGVLVVTSWRKDGVGGIWKNLPLALFPFLAFCALLLWRLKYFGDPMPNPYYAKTTDSSFLGLLNPFGGGWQYLIVGLKESALIALVSLIFFYRRSRFDNTIFYVIISIISAHLLFVIWAKGDWMGQYRFLMPVSAFIVIASVKSLSSFRIPAVRLALSSALSIFLFANTAVQLDSFAANPTTPLSVVSRIGEVFSVLGDRLGIQDPLLAHHDAGGISYDRSVDLLDLGGLVDRYVAKNLSNRRVLEQYIFDQRKPDFIFGAINFAARSGFTDAPEFSRDYIPLVFEDMPIMNAELSSIRREHAHNASGIRIDRGSDGEPIRVVFLAQ